MKKILIAVDLQNDFVSGALGSSDAASACKSACEMIKKWDGAVIATLDTHGEDYLSTAEGAKLPVIHCVDGSEGHRLDDGIAAALDGKEHYLLKKPTFGSVMLPELVKCIANDSDFELTLIGVCTDICVVSNALLLKAHFPDKKITVCADCCAGVTPESHNAALITMKMCQIDVV